MSKVHQTNSVDILECLRCAREGSKEAVGELFGSCSQYLLFIANKELNGNLLVKAGVSDIVQETLLKAHCNLKGFQGNTEGELLAWLRQILISALIDAHRRNKATKRQGNGQRTTREHSSKIPDHADTPSVVMIAGENQVYIERVLLELPEDYRRVIRERIWEQKSFIEIGKAMNRSPEAVRKLWVRGIDQMRKIWQQQHHDELTTQRSGQQ